MQHAHIKRSLLSAILLYLTVSVLLVSKLQSVISQTSAGTKNPLKTTSFSSILLTDASTGVILFFKDKPIFEN